MIDESFGGEIFSAGEIPSREELKLFFDRLKAGRRYAPYSGPYMTVSPPIMDRIYSEDGTPRSMSKFLNYFLTKLSTVIRATKDVELPVDGFIDNCNKYLSLSEPSTDIRVNGPLPISRVTDGKELMLNRSNFDVHVESLPERRRISLDALSSGEKQMISLFAKMFLYSGRKIVLINEPELSLSIDWQREILVDVLDAPLCIQLVAITHSPFVFNNELEPFARALKVGRSEIKFPIESEGDMETDVGE